VENMELRHDVVGAASGVGVVWDQGEAVAAGVEGEDYAVLDSGHAGRDSGIRDDGIAEGVMSGWGVE